MDVEKLCKIIHADAVSHANEAILLNQENAPIIQRFLHGIYVVERAEDSGVQHFGANVARERVRISEISRLFPPPAKEAPLPAYRLG